MNSGHVDRALLLIGTLIMILVTSSIASLSNHAVYAHTFSLNENKLFITTVHKIEAQV